MLDAGAAPVEVALADEGDVRLALPDVAEDAGEEAEGAPALLEPLQGAEPVLGHLKEARVEGVALNDAVGVAHAGSLGRDGSWVLCSHALVELMVLGGGLVGRGLFDLLEEAAGNDLDRLLADGIEVCEAAAEFVVQPPGVRQRLVEQSGLGQVGGLAGGIGDDEDGLLAGGDLSGEGAEEAEEAATRVFGELRHVLDDLIEQDEDWLGRQHVADEAGVRRLLWIVHVAHHCVAIGATELPCQLGPEAMGFEAVVASDHCSACLLAIETGDGNGGGPAGCREEIGAQR